MQDILELELIMLIHSNLSYSNPLLSNHFNHILNTCKHLKALPVIFKCYMALEFMQGNNF